MSNLWWLNPAAFTFGAICHLVGRLRTKRQQRREARVQQQRDQRMADVNARLGHWQPTDNELADVLAIWAADFNTALDQLHDINEQREEEDRP